MAWVLRTERHYTDGKSAVFYHKGFPFGIMHENVGNPKEAQQFRTKKDAVQYRREHGMSRYEPVRLQTGA